MKDLFHKLGLPTPKSIVRRQAPEPSPEQIMARETLHQDAGARLAQGPALQGPAFLDDAEHAVAPASAHATGHEVDASTSDVKTTANEAAADAQDNRLAEADDAMREATDREAKDQKAKDTARKRAAEANMATRLREQALTRPGLAVAGTMAAIGLLVYGGFFARTKGASSDAPPAVVAMVPVKPVETAPPPATRKELDDVTARLDAANRRIETLAARPSATDQLATIVQRLAAVEGVVDALRQNAQGSPAASTAAIETLRGDVESLKGAMIDLATNVDSQMADARRARASASLPARQETYTPPRAAPRRTVRPSASARNALPVDPAPGDSPTAGTTTGSPARGFMLATSGDAASLKPGDTLASYGRINSVKRVDGGVFVDTENGQIFVRDK